VLRARDDLLANETAFLEIDAREQVHVGLVREGFAIGKIHAAFRHARRDAASVIVGALRLRLERVPRRDRPESQRLGARIGRDSERGRARLRGLGQSEDRELIAQGSDRHRRTQPIQGKPLDQIGFERLRAVEQITAAFSFSDHEEQKVEENLALRREQRTKARFPRPKTLHVICHESMQKLRGVNAGDFDDAAICKKEGACH